MNIKFTQQHKTTPVVISAIVLSILMLVFMTEDEIYVAAPGLVCVVMIIWLWMTLWDRDGQIPFFDVGVFCALATLVYTVYPLINYWADGLHFGRFSDNRLQQFNILPEELGFFHWRHVLYLSFLIFSYSFFRGKGTIEIGNVPIPNRSTRQIIIIFFLLLMGFLFALQLISGVNFLGSSYESEAFTKNFDAASNLPLIFLQIANKLGGIAFIFKLALVFIVVSQYKKGKFRMILIAWIVAEITYTIWLKGGRTGLILFLVSIALFYHRMVNPLPMKFLFVSGLSVFAFFNFLGLYRAYINVGDLQWSLEQIEGGFLAGGNEFQALLGTAYDVWRMKEAGVDLPWYLYINDIVNILPPQQIMPFEKIAASEWYLRQIGMSGTGQGFMWGVMSQSIIGLDWLELAFRGAILGYILAKFHRWYLKNQSGFLATLFYVFFCLKIYYTFRDTTFSILTNVVWEIIPFYLLLRIGTAILSRKVRYDVNHSVAIPPRSIR